MSLDEGKKAPQMNLKIVSGPKNYERLITWCNIGADVENGLWACYGARLGCYDTNLNEDFILESISSYDWFKEYFENTVFPNLKAGKKSVKEQN